MTLKFRTRIALFNALAVALITVLVFIAIYLVVYKTAYAHLDADILQEKEEVINSLDWHQDSIIINKMPEWDEAEHNKVEVNPTFLQIVNLKGVVIFHSTNMLGGQFLFDPQNEKGTFYNSEISNQKIRLGQFPIRNESGKTIGQLTIAVSQQESDNILNNLILVLLISFPIVLIAQFLASSLAAAKAIAPVHHLINTAANINDSNIDTRLVLPEHRDELYDLTKTINDLLSRIEKSLVQQKQFTSDASHEIRTPLSAIRGTLEVLVRKKREPQVYEEKITDIISQVDRIDALLSQLLQLARIESGITVVKKEEVHLLDVISVLIEKWNPFSAEKKISVQLDVPENAIVSADKFYLELILDNLISNAIKYSKENGNVLITWNSSLVNLSVQDDGIGISAEQFPNIFHSFYRTDESRSSSVKGNGLGLSIVKKLAGLQQISISVTSQIGMGSSFILQFPR